MRAKHPPPAGGTLFTKEGKDEGFFKPLPSFVKRVAPQSRVFYLFAGNLLIVWRFL